MRVSNMDFSNFYINGFPKSGNHALLRGCELLGIPCQVNHIPYVERQEGKFIFIKRDPRNVVISRLRGQRRPVTPGTFLTFFRKFESTSLIKELEAYEGWLEDPKSLIISYEHLITNESTMKKIADYVGVSYLPKAFERLEGLTKTWNKIHSNYKEIWTQEVEASWQTEGGSELLIRWGYGEPDFSI